MCYEGKHGKKNVSSHKNAMVRGEETLGVALGGGGGDDLLDSGGTTSIGF